MHYSIDTESNSCTKIWLFRYNEQVSEDKGSSEQAVLKLLKEHGAGLAVKEICQRLSFSSMAVRRQLIFLEGHDLVVSRREKQKIGRPLQRYYLTEKGHERFDRRYPELAIELLTQLRVLDGKTKINQLFELRRKTEFDRCQDRVQGKTLEARVHQVTQILTENGYMAKWEKIDENKYLIKEMNCAVAQVARKFPQACIEEEHFLAELLQAKVTRQHHILHKDQFCSYLVEG